MKITVNGKVHDVDVDGQVDTAGGILSGEKGNAATCSRAGPSAVIEATQPKMAAHIASITAGSHS